MAYWHTRQDGYYRVSSVRQYPSHSRRLNPGDPVNTHPSPVVHQRIIKAWWGSLTGWEIAAEEGLAAITVYSIWSRAKKSGKLPATKRPPFGF